MCISVLLVYRSFPWKTCIYWTELKWITKDDDADSTKGFRPVLLQFAENINEVNTLLPHVIFIPKSKVELVKLVTLQHGIFIHNN